MTDYGIDHDGGFPIREDEYAAERAVWDAATARMQDAQHELEMAARYREAVVLDLQSRGLGLRSIAAVLGVTHHQQVDQIARRAKKRSEG